MIPSKKGLTYREDASCQLSLIHIFTLNLLLSSMRRWMSGGAVNFGELSHAIHNYALQNPSDKVILGFGCSAHTVSEGRFPDREFLDTITSKPLLLVKYDGHAAMANSALIRRLPRSVCSCAGYDEKNGWFRQQAFYDAVNHVSKSASILKVMKNLIAGTDVLADRGIAMPHTSEGVGFPLDADVDVCGSQQGVCLYPSEFIFRQ
jgi:hypothetical protein